MLAYVSHCRTILFEHSATQYTEYVRSISITSIVSQVSDYVHAHVRVCRLASLPIELVCTMATHKKDRGITQDQLDSSHQVCQVVLTN